MHAIIAENKECLAAYFYINEKTDHGSNRFCAEAVVVF